MASDGRRPSVLYKYRALRPESTRGFAESIFANQAIYCALATQLNDPLDCKARVSLRASNEELDVAVRSGRITSEVGTVLRRAHTNPIMAIVRLQVERDLRLEIARNMAVLSLSSNPLSPIMWDRYADGHRGICVGFDSSQDFFVDAKPVRYHRVLPIIEYFRHSNEECAELGVLSKTTEWAYEREWRTVGFSSVSRLIGYPRRALVEVIFGARCIVDDVNRFTFLARYVNLNVRLLRAQWTEGRTEVLLEEIT
jgi:hypothetical protein